MTLFVLRLRDGNCVVVAAESDADADAGGTCFAVFLPVQEVRRDTFLPTSNPLGQAPSYLAALCRSRSFNPTIP
jgi:hypothetical protein